MTTDMEVSKGIVELATTPEKLLEHFKKFQEIKRKLLDKNVDIVKIKDKDYVKRSGWQKIALAFNISTRIIKEDREEHPNYFVYRHWVEAIAPNGRKAVGDGACASNERMFNHPEHDIPATSHTRAECRAISNIVGSGEVSAEEMKPEVLK